jgi:DNA-binding response OmpR family regulator
MEEGDYIRVLLIEDNLGDAKFINEMINEARDFRYKFDHAFRLSTGLEYIQKKKYDIILLDLDCRIVLAWRHFLKYILQLNRLQL